MKNRLKIASKRPIAPFSFSNCSRLYTQVDTDVVRTSVISRLALARKVSRDRKEFSREHRARLNTAIPSARIPDPDIQMCRAPGTGEHTRSGEGEADRLVLHRH